MDANDAWESHRQAAKTLGCHNPNVILLEAALMFKSTQAHNARAIGAAVDALLEIMPQDA